MTSAVPLDASLAPSQLGEGMYWDNSTSTLWWVDIGGKQIHHYDPRDKRHRAWSVSKEVSFVFPRGGHLLIGLSDGVYTFNPQTAQERPVALLDLPIKHRLNDGKFDPTNRRLWLGTINTAAEPSETAALYQLQNDRLVEIESGYTNANGKAWSADSRTMFHADTGRDTIWAFDYDIETAIITNKRVFAKTVDGSPDGLETDDQGNLYAAIFGGSRVDVFSSRGAICRRIYVPAPNVTSCCLGGPERKTLFITTAFEGMSDDQRHAAPLSGHVFEVQVDE